MLRLLLRALPPLVVFQLAHITSIVSAEVAVAAQVVAPPPVTPSFVIAASNVTQILRPVLPNQGFVKQWTVSVDADNKIPAIEALVLDLPGQVFVTYAAAPAASTAGVATTAAGVVGTVKVFGANAAHVEAASVVSKRAMKGAKLAISSSGNFLLTEVVLLRKAALKKVITNRWADVVISDDVLFSKKKSDYPFRSFRALQSIESSSQNISARQVERDAFSISDTIRQVNRNWTILMPTSERQSHSLDIHISGQGFGRVRHVDSDLLPEGSIGTVEVACGEHTASVASEAGRDVLRVALKNSTSTSTSTTGNSCGSASVEINLAPNVGVLDITKTPSAGSDSLNMSSRDLNATFPDDAVTLFVNGTGSLFVLANKSAVYAADFNLRVATTGHAQVQLAEIGSLAGITVGRDHFLTMTVYQLHVEFAAVVEAAKVCSWSSNGSAFGYAKESDSSLCKLKQVPVKIGGTNTSSTPSTSVNGKSGAPRAFAVSLLGVVVAAIVIVLA